MKFFLTFFFMGITVSSFANVVLTGGELKISENPVILERVANTPFNNILKLPVVSNVKECVEYHEVTVTERNGQRCGYYVDSMPMCRGMLDCIIFYEQYERTCTYSKSICREYNFYQTEEIREFNLQFSNFTKEVRVRLSVDEDEKLSVDILDIEPSCVKKVFYSKGSKYIGAKLKLKRRCR